MNKLNSDQINEITHSLNNHVRHGKNMIGAQIPIELDCYIKSIRLSPFLRHLDLSRADMYRLLIFVGFESIKHLEPDPNANELLMSVPAMGTKSDIVKYYKF